MIGGPPGAGKTTLGVALAGRLGVGSISVDDLNLATQAVTTPETHPGLHVMRRKPSLEYFTTSTPAELQADATQQHEAVWPMVERVVRAHALRGPSIVIDGWYFRPEWVAKLPLPNVWSGWIVPTEAVLREREERLPWYQESTDPDRMIANFLSRSFWYRGLVEEQAGRHGLTILEQPGNVSVDQMCEQVLEEIGG